MEVQPVRIKWILNLNNSTSKEIKITNMNLSMSMLSKIMVDKKMKKNLKKLKNRKKMNKNLKTLKQKKNIKKLKTQKKFHGDKYKKIHKKIKKQKKIIKMMQINKKTKKVTKIQKKEKKYTKDRKTIKSGTLLSRLLLINCLLFTLQAVSPTGWKSTSNFTNRQSEEKNVRYLNHPRSFSADDNKNFITIESIHWELNESHFKNAAIWKDLKQKFWNQHKHHDSAKIKNREVRSKNGNIIPKIKIIHWNVGARLWCNKITDIEALLLQEKPQLCFISEANLWDQVDMEDRQIPGYSIILPNTMSRLRSCKDSTSSGR